ncbi:MAG: magnesium transporter CorA family protein, partial [Candidatus Omnitrophica bacterium]|nr:magnesium transporter CorA family protein [Candidatus Omnitrophota bacterium]
MIRSFLYKDDKLKIDIPHQEMISHLAQKEGLLWVDIQTTQAEELEILDDVFNFHPLAIEDCLDDVRNPKIDNYSQYLFMVFHAPNSDIENSSQTIELDIFLGPNYVVTYHNKPIHSVESILLEAKPNAKNLFSKGADFLVYFILDHMTDGYVEPLKDFDVKMESIDGLIFEHPGEELLGEIFKLRRDVIQLRRILIPQSETVYHLTREVLPNVSEKAKIYFRDVCEHLGKINGLLETYRDWSSDALHAYTSIISNMTNRTIKVLTVMATFF